MNLTSDHRFMKKMNKSVVFNTIKTNTTISRAQISQITKLNKRTVSLLVDELISDKFVTEIGEGRSSGGRRPVMLCMNKNAGFSIGIDINANSLLGILTNLEGEIIDKLTLKFEDTRFYHVFKLLKQLIETLFDQAPTSPYSVIGIGISISGSVSNDGVLKFSHNLQWTDIHLKNVIEEEFHIPTVVYNDSKAGVIGEKRFGKGQTASNLIYINAGIGIGTGIILNNSLFRGTEGFSGRFGHTVIHANGKRCPCGNKGCWELYASEKALLDQAKSLNKYLTYQTSFPKESINMKTLINWANEGDSQTINLFNQIGEYLAIGIINIINIFNPEMIIIGNKMATAEKWVKPSIMRVIEQNAVSYSRKNLRLEFSNLSIYAGALGVSSMASAEFFNKVHLVLNKDLI